MARILVVEDDVLLRHTVAEWLRDDGHDVLEAACADEGTRILSSVITVDVVITDIEMPGSIDGLEFAEGLRKTSPTLPLIVVSAGRFTERLRTADVAAFFPKPYDLKRLSAFIRRTLSQPKAPAFHQQRAGNEP